MQALADFMRAEPLPWSDFYVARGSVLSRVARGDVGEPVAREIDRLLEEAESMGYKIALPKLRAARSMFPIQPPAAD